MSKTKIEWCDMTVNPVVGCTYGCEYCYARKMNQRFGWIEDFSKPQFMITGIWKMYTKPPKVIFINSMSDIADWETGWMDGVINAIVENPQHTFLALTKRPSEIPYDLLENKPNNFYIGQTITEQVGHYMIPEDIDSGVDFLSIEPLLGPIRMNLECTMVKWVIIGAETGNRKGKVIPEPEWVGYILGECIKENIPVFVKGSMAPYFHRYGNPCEWPDFILKRHPEKGQK